MKIIPTFGNLLLTSLLAITFLILGMTSSYGSTPQNSTGPVLNDKTQYLDVSVLYRERILLPSGSIVTVSLEDVSKMDVKSEIIAQKQMQVDGAPPYQLSIPYENDDINPRNRYTLRAQIMNGDRLLFTSTEHLNPFDTFKSNTIEITVHRVSSPEKKPVADASLVNTRWKALKLYGRKVEIGTDGKELYMVLVAEQKRVRGFAGCNNFSGFFALQQGQLIFERMISTQMMCIESMEQEQRFLQALAESKKFKISGDQLTLLNELNEKTVEFTATYLQ